MGNQIDRTELLRASGVETVTDVSTRHRHERLLLWLFEGLHLQHYLSALVHTQNISTPFMKNNRVPVLCKPNLHRQTSASCMSPQWWDHSSQSTHCGRTGLFTCRQHRIRGSGGFSHVGQSGRTSQAALPNATLSKQIQTSADAACDGISWQGGGFSCARGGGTGGRVGADTPAPRTTTLNSRLRMRCVSIDHLLPIPCGYPAGIWEGQGTESGLGSPGSDGNLDLGKKNKNKKGGSSHQGW